MDQKTKVSLKSQSGPQTGNQDQRAPDLEFVRPEKLKNTNWVQKFYFVK